MKTIFGTSVARYLAPLLLLVVSVGYVAMALDFPADARTMPLLVGLLLLLMAPIDLVSLTGTRLGEKIRQAVNREAGEPPKYPGTTGQQFHALAWVVGFAAMMALAGIAVAVPLYVTGSLRFLGRKTWTQAALTGAICGIGIFGLFQLGLGVELYSGLLFQ